MERLRDDKSAQSVVAAARLTLFWYERQRRQSRSSFMLYQAVKLPRLATRKRYLNRIVDTVLLARAPSSPSTLRTLFLQSAALLLLRAFWLNMLNFCSLFYRRNLNNSQEDGGTPRFF